VDPFDAGRVYSTVRAFAIARWRDRAFFRLLNRLLFRAAAPSARVRVLEQFYGRPADLIGRFYAARLTRLDRVRLLSGWPPVPLHRALAQLGG
jgi:lycopene beta-cyclase